MISSIKYKALINRVSRFIGLKAFMLIFLLFKLVVSLVLIYILQACNTVKNEHVNIFAAASLNQVVTEAFVQNDSVQYAINAASSGILAKQIEAGAACDIFISANKNWVIYLENIGLIDKNNVAILAKNQLVVIIPAKDSVVLIPGLTWHSYLVKKQMISIGDPEHVPAGNYARQALQNLNLYDSISSKLIMAKDVVSALKLVEMGEVDAGIVYKTDAMNPGKVLVVGTIADSLHDPIYYYMVPISERGKELIEKDGFVQQLNKKLEQKGFGFKIPEKNASHCN